MSGGGIGVSLAIARDCGGNQKVALLQFSRTQHGRLTIGGPGFYSNALGNTIAKDPDAARAACLVTFRRAASAHAGRAEEARHDIATAAAGDFRKRVAPGGIGNGGRPTDRTEKRRV